MKEPLEEALTKGVEMHMSGEFDLASQLYASVLKLQPDHADANHNMGLLKLDTGNALDALPYLQTALQADTRIAQFWLSYTKALVKLEKLDAAARIIDLAKESGIKGEEFLELNQLLNTPNESSKVAEEKVVASSPSEEAINQLLNLYEQGQLAAAAQQAQLILQQYPDSFAAWNILGATNSCLGNNTEAAIAFKQVTEINPSYADGYNNLGVTLKELGNLDKAITAFKKAISLKPDYAEAHNNMGNALQDQGKLEKAVVSYKSALSLQPDHAETYYNMGNALQQQAKPDEAIKAYRKALANKPDYAEAYNNMGNVLQDLGKLEEAIVSYKKALSLQPDHAETYYNMGNALQEQGKPHKAIEAYNKALMIKPDYAQAYSNATELLKVYSQPKLLSQGPISINQEITELGRKILVNSVDKQIAFNISSALNCINRAEMNFKTPLSQIYKRNAIDLNCARHKKVFNEINVIPEFCFGCFKVQITVKDLFSLIRLTKLFYELNFETDLARKMVVHDAVAPRRSAPRRPRRRRRHVARKVRDLVRKVVASERFV